MNLLYIRLLFTSESVIKIKIKKCDINIRTSNINEFGNEILEENDI